MFFFAVKIFSDSSEKLGAIITSKNVLTISFAVSVSSSALSPTIPPKAETQGKTEEIIGSWFKKTGNREKVIIASKVAGRSGMKWFRGKETRLNKEQILEAVEGSLMRLQTDYIDLYQIHWPDRKSNFFGKLGYEHQEESDIITIKEQLEVLGTLVKSGKIRHIGLSNETPWGLMKFISLAEQYDLPRVVSIQNPYSLLNRSFEVGLAEISIREKSGLLAYSPLGFGMLTGKYDNGQNPDDARLTLFGDMFTRYTKPKGRKVALKLNILALDNDLTPTQMALSYVNSRPFITSNIIGATKMDQLKENIESVEIELNEEIIEEIENIHIQDPYPCP